MPDPPTELYAIRFLAKLSALKMTNIRDAKSAFGLRERGLDVVFNLDGRRIGAQHTIYHGDEGQTPGKRGSHVRASEEAIAGRSPSAFSIWTVADFLPALTLRIQEKCAIAVCHDNGDVVDESWLVVSAGLPRLGAAASTMIAPEFVHSSIRTGELNQASNRMLSESRFQCVYLVLHIGNALFGWNRQEGWHVVADPDAAERKRCQALTNDLIFNQIPAWNRRGG